MKFEFVEEKERYNARIKVVGVGGAGGNAINNMINSELKGVDFIVANTDSQDIDRSACHYKIQLGPSITMGLGAGGDPEMGRLSAEESIDEIKDTVHDSDMVFITAGMGGGTGTGASPVVARECKDSSALTVAVVTKPFNFEGEKRMKRAMEGIECLKNEVDSLIIIPNERLRSLSSNSTTFQELISRADEVLLHAVRGISDLIMSNGYINLDFADVKRVMQQMGAAIMGMGRASGENRATEAAQMAINSPLLEDISINSAKGLLMNITGPPDMTMDEIEEASNFIKEEVNGDADIFWGVVLDDTMDGEVQATVIATGIDSNANGIDCNANACGNSVSNKYDNVVHIRDVTPEEADGGWTARFNGVNLDTPTYLRNREGVGLSATMDENETSPKKKGFLSRFTLKENLDYPTFLRLKAD